MIVCYAPTEDAEDKMMYEGEFYEELDEVFRTKPQHDMLLVAGDFNAKVGKDNTDKWRTTGKQGVGHIENKGERLVELCEENNLVIGGTLSGNRDVHKVSWRSPDYNEVAQIDHVIINQKWSFSLHDVKVCRGVQVGCKYMLVISETTKSKEIRRKTTVARCMKDEEPWCRESL